MDNGLIRRTFRVSPNGATVGLDHHVTGQSLLRGVKPEAKVSINGRDYEVGGLVGQPNYAYLLPEWLDQMTAAPEAMRLVGYEVGKPAERLRWKHVRHHAPNVAWPPRGTYLRMEYALPIDGNDVASDANRALIMRDEFVEMDSAWKVRTSKGHRRTSFENEGKPGEIYALSGGHCFAERAMPRDGALVEVKIHPGTDRGVSWGPGLAIAYSDRVIKVSLRPGDRGEHGHFELRDNGAERLKTVPSFADSDGGLKLDRAYRLRARIRDGSIRWEAARESATEPVFHLLFETKTSRKANPVAVRVGKMDRRGGASDDRNQPGPLGRCRIEEFTIYGPSRAAAEERGNQHERRGVTVSVHYEMYDGIPSMSKWITVNNPTDSAITVDRFSSELLAVVEHSNWVETREGVSLPKPDSLHVETDFSFSAFNHEAANRHVVHWRKDPQYSTQVNYRKDQPCLLVVEPTYGPAQDIPPGQTFESCRAFELFYDSTDRERRGLSLKRMYRTVAPWVTENPLMHHMKVARPDAVRQAIDQASEVGFEMIIMSFGSGFDMDSEDAEYLDSWRSVADYAKSKGIEIGSYSLLSSRGAPKGNMIVPPDGKRCTHGQCPALTSPWGQDYFRRLYRFFPRTGFSLLEHDGSYPGDVDTTSRPPLQKGTDDSRWVQWRIITDYYKWCREHGIYLNVPDYYFLSGSNKCGMGYREVNWSLPRAMQVIHTRQNIYDGTWKKTPSMGWMFVPLSQYHGGGAAATIEPLHRHLAHYERMMMSNLAMGVQACYRGPRLFDTDETKTVVKRCVDWFLKYRDILESDMIHGR